jgi:hypothetical protein
MIWDLTQDIVDARILTAGVSVAVCTRERDELSRCGCKVSSVDDVKLGAFWVELLWKDKIKITELGLAGSRRRLKEQNLQRAKIAKRSSRNG